MPEINESQIKIALSAARDAHRKYSKVRLADLYERSQILKTNQRAVENLFASYLTKTGFEIDKFNKIREQNQTELRRILEEIKADAIKQSSSIKDTLRYGVNSQRKTIEHLAALTPPDKTNIVILASPFLISQTDALKDYSSNIEPWKSWAKFRLDYDKPGRGQTQALSFWFYWENPSDSEVFINVDTYLVLNGFCSADAQKPWEDIIFYPNFVSSSGVHLQAELKLVEWLNQQFIPPIGQVDQTVLDLSVILEGLFHWEKFDATPVSGNYNLSYNRYLVRPHGEMVFGVTLSIDYANDFGGSSKLSVDFERGSHEVMCPSVLITLPFGNFHP